MSSSTTTRSNSDAMSADIKGMSYALYQMPGDADGTYAVIKVLNVPDETGQPMNQSPPSVRADTPLHLCDSSKLITQHRLGNHSLPYRTIDPRLYDQSEIDWYGAGVLQPPMYMCFIYALKCYLCGDMQVSGDDIHGECTENFREGYRFCTACAPYFRQAMYKTLAPLWRFRLAYERADRRSPVWVHRTRRDELGNSDRTNSGRPFRYTRWYVSSWITRKSMNKHNPNPDHHFEEDLICVEEWNVPSDADPMSKTVSVMDVFFANRGSLTDPNYDPNADDPLNQIRHMSLDEKREIMRRESAPFE